MQRNRATSVGSHNFGLGESLLSGSFTKFVLASQGCSNGSFGGGTGDPLSLGYVPGQSLTFNDSSFLNFSNVQHTDRSIALSAVTPIWGRRFQAGSINSLNANSAGLFSSDPAPVVVALPEPEVWGMMVVGFGLIGVQVRRRALQSAVAA